jgi:hypothetical protein
LGRVPETSSRCAEEAGKGPTQQNFCDRDWAARKLYSPLSLVKIHTCVSESPF